MEDGRRSGFEIEEISKSEEEDVEFVGLEGVE